MTISYVKNVLRRAAKRFGLDVRPIAAGAGSVRVTLRECYDHLTSKGFQPDVILDVGVATGTPDLYDAFPHAYLMLVEALGVFEPDLNAILSKRQGSYVVAAAGSTVGEVMFNQHSYRLDGSSLYKESMGEVADGIQVTVNQIRLDDLVRERELTGGFLIKVDVQGAELDVLGGAEEVLKNTEVVVLEVSLFEFMKGAPQFAAVVAFMSDRGYVAYDMVHGWNRPLDNALGQIDIVFVKDTGPFRKEHRYASPDQLCV